MKAQFLIVLFLFAFAGSANGATFVFSVDGFHQAQPDSSEIIQQVLQQAIQHRRNREYSLALGLTPILISYGERHQNKEILEWGYLLSGHSLLGLRQFSEAERFYRKVFSVIDPDYAAGMAMAYNNLGNLFRVTGDYDNSIVYLERSLSYNLQVPGNEMALSINYLTLSQLYAQQLKFGQALDYNIIAQNTYNGERINMLNASILNQSGRLLEQIGFYDNALIYFEQVAEIAEQGGFRGLLVDSYFNMGTVYANLGNKEMAARYFEKYLPYLDNMEGHIRWNRYLVIADFYSVNDDHGQALQLLSKANEVMGSEPSSLNKVHYFRSKGQLLNRAGKYREANEAFRKIFEDESLNMMHVANSVNYWAKALNQFHLDRKRAFELADKALFHTERERRETGLGSSVTSGFYGSYHQYYVRLADELFRDGKFHEGADLLETARSRAFRDDLIISQIDLSHLLDWESLNRVQALRRELHHLEQSMLEAGPADIGQLEIERSNLERSINLLIESAYRSNPGVLTNLDTPILRLEDARKSLKVGEGILQFGVSANRAFALLSTRSGHHYHHIDTTGDGLAQYITNIREAVTGQLPSNEIKPMLEEAGRLFLGDLPLQGLNSVLVLKDGPLNYLPIEMFRHNGKYLIEMLTIRYAPSLSVRQILMDRGDSPNEGLLALVNPDFGEMAPGTASYNRRDIRPLPYSELEGRMIASSFPGTVELYNSEQANEALVKKLKLESYRIIHMATHGILDDRNPRFSGIVLSTPANPDDLDDGFLRLGEIYDLKLNADLVVLSACDTGLGKIINGEGVMGFQRAFMFAGARSVAVSLWSVFDRSTAMLMRNFYREIAAMQPAGNPDYSIALRNAKLDMLNDPATSHPVHWAPFIIYGK